MPRRWPFGTSVVLMLGGAAAALVGVLPAGLLLSAPDTDVVGQFLAWRSFAAERMLAGDLPLWNPHTYAGQSFVGGFQSALFYPPNVLFLCVPIERAINLSLLWHLVWLGWGMAIWARGRGCSPAASALAGVVLPLSGPVFPHLYAGHLSNLCTMAWAPWIFVGLDRSWRHDRRDGLVLAAVAVALQVLGGHVQYAFYTATAVGLYTVVTMVTTPAFRGRAIPTVLLVYLGGAALAAVQLVPGLTAAAEGLHSRGVDFDYVRVFSFPPENVLTLFAPSFFGGLSVDTGAPLYWGRGYLWEMTVFTGVAGVVLGWIAVNDYVDRRSRSLCYLVIPFVLGVAALGANTPLLRWLYDWVPGFGSFRGLSKFTFPWMLFVTLGIAAGADVLLRGVVPRRIGLIAGLAGGAVLLSGMWVLVEPGRVATWLTGIRATGESGLPHDLLGNATFARGAGLHAGLRLLAAGGLFIVVAGGVHLARRRPRWRVVPLVLLPMELVGFAISSIGVSSIDDAVPDAIRTFVTTHPGHYRVVNGVFPNNGFLLGMPDAGGNDPGATRRYAEFVTASEGGDPDRATQHLPFSRVGPALAMLRVRFAFVRQKEGIQSFENRTPPLPHVLLVPNYRVAPTRDEALAAVLHEAFDPRQTVVLEQKPIPEPVNTAPPGMVRVLGETSDTLEIEAIVSAPTILVITDGYSRDWRARPLTPGPQTSYEVLPANYVLRAIPLAAGHHHLVLEYRPSLFMTGAVVSLLAIAMSLGLWLRLRGRPRQHVPTGV